MCLGRTSRHESHMTFSNMSSFQVLNLKFPSHLYVIFPEVCGLYVKQSEGHLTWDFFAAITFTVDQTGLLSRSWTDLSDTDLTSTVQRITASSSPSIWGEQRQQMVEWTHMVCLVITPPAPAACWGRRHGRAKSQHSDQICGSIDLVRERNPGTSCLWIMEKSYSDLSKEVMISVLLVQFYVETHGAMCFPIFLAFDPEMKQYQLVTIKPRLCGLWL